MNLLLEYLYLLTSIYYYYLEYSYSTIKFLFLFGFFLCVYFAAETPYHSIHLKRVFFYFIEHS